MRRLFGYASLALLLTAAVLLAVSKFLPRMNDRAWVASFTATGQVTGFLKNNKERIPLVSFVAEDGIPYLFEAEDVDSTLQQGQIVTIRYLLSPSLKASLVQDYSTEQLIYAISGCFFTAAGLTFLILLLRQSTLQKQLVLYGARISAVVTGMNANQRIHVIGRCLYTVKLTARSPLGIGEISIIGKILLKPSTSLSIGSTIPVLMEINNPRQHIILWEEACFAGSASVAAP